MQQQVPKDIPKGYVRILDSQYWYHKDFSFGKGNFGSVYDCIRVSNSGILKCCVKVPK
jgi:hypothetical protein